MLQRNKRKLIPMSPQAFEHMVGACGDLGDEVNLNKLAEKLREAGVSVSTSLLEMIDTTSPPVREPLQRRATAIDITIKPIKRDSPKDPIDQWNGSEA